MSSAWQKRRIQSLDVLRGLVMVLMTVDHAREYSSGPGGLTDPMDLEQVTPLLYAMRWISHFCAPAFTLLMGVSAAISGAGQQALWRRGLLLLLMEFTVVGWAWTFNPVWPRLFFQVIGALGVAMLALAVAVRLPMSLVAVAGLLIVAGHNLLDGVGFAPGGAMHYAWSLLHQKNLLPLAWGYEVRTTYPVLPVVGLALCGYAIGGWWLNPAVATARRRMIGAGAALCASFVLLRVTNVYGDPGQFTVQDDLLHTLFSLGNTTKYPLSLQFILMTIGPSLLLLGWMHGRTLAGVGWLEVLGRTPFFYYVAHLYLLHLMAWAWALATGHPFSTLNVTVRFGGIPETFGFPLWATLPFAGSAVVLLLPLCRRYLAWRRDPRFPWLRYL